MTEQGKILRNPFLVALGINFVWINASEVWRYLYIIRPMLQETFPAQGAIAPFDLGTFALWSIWDTVLIISATGFFWIYQCWAGPGLRQALMAAGAFTICVFGLLWLGVANMGLAPYRFLWVALPLAFLEMAVAAYVCTWSMRRHESKSGAAE